MSRTILLALLPLVLAASACRSTPSGGDGFRTIAQGYQSGLAGVQTRTARTESEWRKLWAEHASTQIPRPPEPRIDFAKEMVVCVLAGEKPSGGYGVEVVDADFDGSHLVLGVRETRPAEGAIVPMVLTRPYHMVATPITSAGVRVEKR